MMRSVIFFGFQILLLVSLVQPLPSVSETQDVPGSSQPISTLQLNVIMQTEAEFMNTETGDPAIVMKIKTTNPEPLKPLGIGPEATLGENSTSLIMVNCSLKDHNQDGPLDQDDEDPLQADETTGNRVLCTLSGITIRDQDPEQRKARCFWPFTSWYQEPVVVVSEPLLPLGPPPPMIIESDYDFTPPPMLIDPEFTAPPQLYPM